MKRNIEKKESDWLVSIDFGQIEARVICMFSRDKRYTKAIFDGYDVHKFWGEKVVNRYPEAVDLSSSQSWQDLDDKKQGKFRGKIKNGLVFPWFYLSSHASVARNLGVPKEIMKELYEEFWDYFAGVRKWQKEVVAFSKKYGYVETLTGRRRYCPLGYTKLANTPVQGTGSDIVVNAGNRLSLASYELQKPQLQYRLNIHDDLTFIIPDKNLDDDILTIVKEMVNPCYDWCSVPLTAEVSAGRNWYDQTPIHTFDSRDFGHFGGW